MDLCSCCCCCRGRWPGGEQGDERAEVWSRPERYSYRPRSAPAKVRAWVKSGDFWQVDGKLNGGERMVGWVKRSGEAVEREAPMTSTNPTASMECGSAQRSAHRRGRQVRVNGQAYLDSVFSFLCVFDPMESAMMGARPRDRTPSGRLQHRVTMCTLAPRKSSIQHHATLQQLISL